MREWIRDLHWSLYYEHGIRWLSKPPKRDWHILLLPGMAQPPPRAGYTQIVTQLTEQQCGLTGGSQMPTDASPLYGLRMLSQQMSRDNANTFLRGLFGPP